MLCALAYSCKTDLKLPNEGSVPVSSEANGKTPFISVVWGEVCNNHNYKLRVFGFEPKPPLSSFRFAENAGEHCPPPFFFMYEDVKIGVSFSVILLPSVSSHCEAKFSNPGQSGYKEKGSWGVQCFWSPHK